ncbi:hypothetical protein BDP55DRAFT_697612 [Colletotrichum godetiae]|uniref:Rhodopsin domain-containing protein n=1 Tax=Colletotrichum godetiae TaxID=1209918 RepID=A0AAJ0ADJ1_9PEZI|nr:uncharacterized protein BDP55DRAFT_697612 [Colletotrichum godetiae]KAK1659591.1 hypothetical protein BDP55DRAFT_697612 [Colletotrichum godetiae]
MALDPLITAAFGPPPEGVDLAENQATKNNSIVIVLLAIAALSVASRLIARGKYGPGLSLDDYAIVIALILVAATAGMVIAIGQAGAGRHVWALGVDDLVQTSELLYIYSFIFCTAVFTTKISILLFYWRVFMGNVLSFRLSMWIGALLVGSYAVYFMITIGFCCNPLSHYWTQFYGTVGTCIDVGRFFFILAIINLSTDVILLAIPVPEILRLQMTKEKKVVVCGILSLGGFAVRVHYLKQFSTATDITWMMGPVAIWSSVEPSVGILSACLPSFKPLLRAIRGRKIDSSSLDGKGSTYPLGSRGTRSTRPRLRLDDEIALQSRIVGGEGCGSVHSGHDSEFGRHIHVKTDFKQIINGDK